MSDPPRYQAVIFDLFGTLVDQRGHELAEVFEDVAGFLGCSSEQLRQAWLDTATPRNLGAYRTAREQFLTICQRLSIQPDAEALAAAEVRYLDQRKDLMQPRGGVVEMLQRLQRLGMRRGLISNCAWWDAELFMESALASHFDVVALSAAEGVMKPDAQIFRATCSRLGVEPSECLYVGDGGSRELTAARTAGMAPVLITVPYEDSSYSDGREDIEDWDGLRVTSIPEVLPLVYY